MGNEVRLRFKGVSSRPAEEHLHPGEQRRAERGDEPRTSAQQSDSFVGIELESQAGIELFKGCKPEHLKSLAKIMRHHQVETHRVEAGLATATIILNAFGLANRPVLEQYSRSDWKMNVRYMTPGRLHSSFAQDDAAPSKDGLTLVQLGQVLRAAGARAATHHTADDGEGVSLDAFRAVAKESLADSDTQILVNFAAVDSPTRGFISAISAYNERADSFLIDKVTPPKAEPLWVETRNLHAAMCTVDPGSSLSRVIAPAMVSAAAAARVTPTEPAVTSSALFGDLSSRESLRHGSRVDSA